jgi:tetratricopeptide (TPR) repeat protein
MSPVAFCLALVLAGSPADPLVERGVRNLLDARFDEAAALFGEAAAADPASPVPGFYLGYHCWLRQLATEGDFAICEPAVENAIAGAQRAVRRNPDSALAHYYLGRSYGLRVRQVATIKTFKAATADLRRCRKELGKAEKLDPSLRTQSVEMGLYNYLVGKLPTLAKVVRFLFRLPGGSKEEGLARL